MYLSPSLYVQVLFIPTSHQAKNAFSLWKGLKVHIHAAQRNVTQSLLYSVVIILIQWILSALSAAMAKKLKTEVTNQVPVRHERIRA